MKVKKVEVEGYRSLRAKVELIVEPDVTIVLGPNDHGKTNLLAAMLHLNDDTPYDADRDLNWDSVDRADSLPSVKGFFELTSEERDWLLGRENKERVRRNGEIAARLAMIPGPASEGLADEEEAGDDKDAMAEAGADYEDDDEQFESLPVFMESDIPKALTASRIGAGAALEIPVLSVFSRVVISEFKTKFMPRFELISASTSVTDRATKNDLARGQQDFMRGIFYYAGIDPDDAESLFQQNDVTQKKLKNASDTLNKTLRESWSQGKLLNFQLSHHSKSESIELQIEDPSVVSRYVRASHRSSGFTHYFSLKTMLFARQKDHPSNSHVWLFDEPGVFLHPSGQFDLLQVLETLAAENQILYVTHSLFMLNKTFPGRHRLIMKDESGTKINGKPYVGRWEAALEALGLTLVGSILFANHVLLTEGDADPIYIYAILQKAVGSDQANLDLNSLSVMATSDAQHAELLVRLLCETQPRPNIAVLLDGDDGGQDRLTHLKKLLEKEGVRYHKLPKDTSIEDHLPMIKEAYIPALASYVLKLKVPDSSIAETDRVELVARLTADYEEQQKTKTPPKIVPWTQDVSVRIGELPKPPSKVGLAREYVGALSSTKEFRLGQHGEALVQAIQKGVQLRSTKLNTKNIIAE